MLDHFFFEKRKLETSPAALNFTLQTRDLREFQVAAPDDTPQPRGFAFISAGWD